MSCIGLGKCYSILQGFAFMRALADEPQRSGDVVLIVAEGELAERAVKHLYARFPGLVVLREGPETKWQIIKRRTRLLGPIVAWGQVAAGLTIRLVARINMARALYRRRLSMPLRRHS